MATNKVAVLIPAFNEAATIGKVVSMASTYSKHVLVVDDGSRDATGEAAKSAGVEVLRHSRRRGLGAALHDGFSHLFSRGFSTVVTIDGDGAHDPRLVPELVKYHHDTGADLTVGSRFLNEPSFPNFPSPKRAANRFATLLLRRVAGVNLTDVASGMRAVGPKAMNLSGLPCGYGFTFALVCAATAERLLVNEYAITCRYDAREVFATRRSEIVALLRVALRRAHRAKERAAIRGMWDCVKSFTAIGVRLEDSDFFFHPIRDYNLYLIQEQHSFFTSLGGDRSLIQF